jgi:hypothetical protein
VEYNNIYCPIPETRDVNGREIKKILTRVDKKAEKILHSAIQADDTIPEI